MSKAYVILEAVRLFSNASISALQQLIARHAEILKLELVLRILLTYLPESTEPETYVDFLRKLLHGDLGASLDDEDGSLSIQHEISELEARQRVRRLHLLPIADPQHSYNESMDSFTLFLLHRAFRIDAETGSIPLVAQLVEPFLGRSIYLRTWAVSTLLPILRLDYEYYSYGEPAYSLEAFEQLSGSPAVQGLLSKAAQRKSEESNSVGRDLRGLVGPWMYGQNANKRRKIETNPRRRSSVGVQAITEGNPADVEVDISRGWADVNDWLLELATRDHIKAVEAITQWDGPNDVDFGGWGAQLEDRDEETSNMLQSRYAQAALSAVYATNSSTLDTVIGSHRILRKIAKLLNLRLPPDLENLDSASIDDISNDYLEALSPSNVLHNMLLRADNLLTNPTNSAVMLSYCLLASDYILQSHNYPKACRGLLGLVVFCDEPDQLAELRRLLHTIQSNTRSQQSWESIRHQVLRLHNWKYKATGTGSPSSEESVGLFCRVPPAVVENELLKAMLDSSCYELAVQVYFKQEERPLPQETVEKTVLDVALASYDSASNGNRNRGGMLKASEIISTFRECFPTSQALTRANALLTATHSMSYYSLTLQHGVPFQPVNIRAHKDPMLLVGKILEQNPRGYTKLDDLLDIGQHLVAAGLVSTPEESDSTSDPKGSLAEQIFLAKRRITGMAIEAALRENDFDTAYSYVVNRLPPPPPSSSALNPPSDLQNDISWRAAYHAGCHKPTNLSSGPSALRRLEQRMELLSQALLLAPPASLSEILTVWRRCEEDLNIVFAREAAEEEKWNTKGDRHIPGGFAPESIPTVQKSREPSRAAMNEEAPMGLFEVARGAASALSKNAFPLRSPTLGGGSSGGLQSPRERSLSKMGSGASDSGSGTDLEGHRVRKRDMVSNMVTGGLASGIGWVLGAPPVKPEE